MTCDRPAATARQAGVRPWRCRHCGRFIGRIVAGVLHEANGNRSNVPCVRRCPDCGRRNVALQ
jgi:rubredoxin